MGAELELLQQVPLVREIEPSRKAVNAVAVILDTYDLTSWEKDTDEIVELFREAAEELAALYRQNHFLVRWFPSIRPKLINDALEYYIRELTRFVKWLGTVNDKRYSVSWTYQQQLSNTTLRITEVIRVLSVG